LFGFLPLLMILYFLVKNRKFRNIILLVFSLIFYSWGEPKYVILMLLTTLVAYLFGLLINKLDIDGKFIKKKISFIICVILLISGLLFFKYINFFITNLNSIFSIDIDLLDVVLPIGISFYTFQILSYVIDLYNKKIKVQNDFFSLALYVAFFPQLIAGPIVRYETIEDEINNRKENFDDVVKGIERFIIGLSKKVIVANQMAVFADFVFNSYTSSFGTSIMWLGVICYTFQIYFDFSGYSDMAIGLGQIFGFHFLENFDYPYISKSITEFWRRWHMSLSSWFRDYVYIPLGGNRVNKYKWIRNVLIVWCLTGFWHGASWNFVLWGLYYCFFLLLEKLVLNKFLDKVPDFIRWIFTIIVVLFGWLLFRANTFEDMIVILKNMFIYNETNWIDILSNDFSVINSLLFLIPAFIFSFPIMRNINNKYCNFTIYNVIYNCVLLFLLLICVVYLTSSSYNPFIYFRF